MCPEKPGRPCFLASFITMESSKISSSTADLHPGKVYLLFWATSFLACLGGLVVTALGFGLEDGGSIPQSLSTPYGLYLILIEIHEKNCHQFTHFWKALGNKSSNQKLPFWQVKMKKMWVLQYANNIDKIVGYTAIQITKLGWTSPSSLFCIVFACYGPKVSTSWS